MEPKFQSSFIPKGPVSTASPLAASYDKPKTTIFGFIATLLFVISIVLALGVFGYERYLLASIGTMGQNLEDARATLEPDTIKELVSADKRILGTRLLIDRHTALSPFFDYLESATMKNVRFTDFSYAATPKGIEIIMKGQAKSYADIALESDAFNKSKMFIAPVFSDLELDPKGNVTFTFRAQLDPAAVSYKKRIAPVMPVVVPVATTAQVVATSTATTTATSTKR